MGGGVARPVACAGVGLPDTAAVSGAAVADVVARIVAEGLAEVGPVVATAVAEGAGEALGVAAVHPAMVMETKTPNIARRRFLEVSIGVRPLLSSWLS